jgi:hypothetical protein
MPDDITPAPGEQTPPPASPDNAGNPPENGEQTPAKTEDKQPEVKAPVKTPWDYARERILRRENEQLRAKKEAEKSQDTVDPAEKEAVLKAVRDEYGDLLPTLDQKLIEEDVNKAINASEYSKYMTPAEKDSVHKLSLNPSYAQLPYKDLITLSIAGRMTEISASIAKEASEKINNTQIPQAGSNTTNSNKKDVNSMTDAEYAEYRKTELGLT